MIAASLVLVTTYTGKKTTSTRNTDSVVPREPVSLEGAVEMGDPRASVALIEYSDFECPYCARFAREVLPEIERLWVTSGKVLIAFRHFPLANHVNARKAAEAAVCAGRQGKFWEMHDLLFSHAGQVSETDLAQATGLTEIDGNKFTACINGEAGKAVENDLRSARFLGVRAAPTVFLGSVERDRRVKVSNVFVGARTAAELIAAIRALLAETRR